MINKTPLVSIIMMTYGHQYYIADAINGVLLQKVNFDVELLIADDCSPDTTKEIVESIVDQSPSNFRIRYVRHEINKGISDNFLWAARQITGKYVALCEGDDYWTDPEKLQKQVDFLDKNTDYSFCCHRFQILREDDYRLSSHKGKLSGIDNTDKEFAHNFYGQDDLEIDYQLFYETWITQPLTTIFVGKYLNEMIMFAEQFKNFRDIHLFYFLLKKGKGISLNQFMGVYRRHLNGIESKVTEMEALLFREKLWRELFMQIPTDNNLRSQYVEASVRVMKNKKNISRLTHYAELIKYSSTLRNFMKITYNLFRKNQ